MVQFQLIKNLISLYAIHAVRLLLPLVTIPYIARVLPATEFGQYMFFFGIASWAAMLCEYGFNLSATRAIAQATSNDEIRDTVAGVQSAKLLLCLPMFLLVLAPLVFSASGQGAGLNLVASALLLSLATVLSPQYFFQGRQQLTFFSMVDVLFGLAGVLAIFVVVANPGDAWKILLIHALMRLASTVITSFLMYRESGAGFTVNLRGARTALSSGFTLFVHQASVSLYTSGNVVILGLLVSPVLVGYYAAAERLVRAALGLIGPASMAIFPYFSDLVAKDHPDKEKTYLMVVRLFLVLSLIAGAALAALAPVLVPWFLGDTYQSSVLILQIFALLVPIIAMSNVFGVQYMLPHGMDRLFNAIILVAGVLNLLLAVVLVSKFGVAGMAWSVVTVEAVVTIAMMICVIRHMSRRGAS